MQLSPEQKSQVVQTVARMITDELRAEMGGSLAPLICIELSVAEKMTCLSRKTLKAKLPVVELSDGKHAVRLADLQTYLKQHTSKPLRGAEPGTRNGS